MTIKCYNGQQFFGMLNILYFNTFICSSVVLRSAAYTVDIPGCLILQLLHNYADFETLPRPTITQMFRLAQKYLNIEGGKYGIWVKSDLSSFVYCNVTCHIPNSWPAAQFVTFKSKCVISIGR